MQSDGHHSPAFGIPEAAGETGGPDYWRNQLEQIRPVDPSIPVHHIFLEGDPAYYGRRGYRIVESVQWEETNYRSVVLSKPLSGSGFP